MRKHPRFRNLSLKDIPETTREQLVYLVDGRGYTVTSAIVLAVRLLHQEEYAVHVEEIEDGFVQQIEVEFSESALFGDTDMTTVDAAASVDRYAALLRSALREHDWDRDTDITVRCGIDDKYTADGDGSSDEAIEIGEIVNEVWQDWGWIVNK